MDKHYSAGIDFLRAFAVIGVILYHLPQYSFQGGNQGVTIFFVISGYLMAKNASYAYQKKQFSWIGFYKKRIKRIYPFLLFSLLIFILIAGSIQIRMLGNIKSELPSLLFGYNNWWQIHEKVSYFDRFANSSLFKHYWSLAVELQFYLVFPLFFLTVMRLSRKRGYQLMYLLTIISILTSLLSPFSIAYYNTFARLYPFIVGMFGFFNRKNINDVISSKKVTKFWLIMSCLTLAVFIPLPSFTGSSLLVSVLTMLLLVLINDKEVEKRTKITKFRLQYIGKISYELYLVHYSVFILLVNIAPKMNPLIELVVVLIMTVLMIAGFHSFMHLKRKAGRYLGAGLVAVAIGMIIFAPTNRLTADQNELKQELSSNLKKIENQPNQKGNILFLGDSVMLGAYQELEDTFSGQATVDAKESRQISSLATILQGYPNLADYSTVVIGLGTNGIISDESIDEILTQLKDKQIYWITIKCPEGWQESVNQKLAELPSRYKNVNIIDWFGHSKDHPEYFYDDETHLNGEGRSVYAQLMKSVLSK